MVENKDVMGKNIKKYMDKKGVTAAEVCRALNFKQNTFSNWVNGKIYPRINKVEAMAQYFGISKAALVEDSENIVLSPKEQKIILNYREFDEQQRKLVDKMLLNNDEE